jgi:hypothetical protein
LFRRPKLTLSCSVEGRNYKMITLYQPDINVPLLLLKIVGNEMIILINARLSQLGFAEPAHAPTQSVKVEKSCLDVRCYRGICFE